MHTVAPPAPIPVPYVTLTTVGAIGLRIIATADITDVGVSVPAEVANQQPAQSRVKPWGDYRAPWIDEWTPVALYATPSQALESHTVSTVTKVWVIYTV